MSRYLPDGCTHNPWNDCACGAPMCDASCEIEDEDSDEDEEPEE